MPARPDPAQLSAWRRLLEAHAAVTELLEHELVAERGLPLSRYDVLLNLAEAPEGRLRMQELSASVLLSKSGLSRLVDRMVEAGLGPPERCQDDRRGWFAVLTDQGRSALRRAAPVHLRGIQEHFAQPPGARGGPGPDHRPGPGGGRGQGRPGRAPERAPEAVSAGS
jgi:DNA-binding MarR family transcriptional regulator